MSRKASTIERIRVRRGAWPALAVALVATACASLPGLVGAPPERIDRTDRAPGPEPPPRTVVLISVDGLAPWVLEGTETPTLDALARAGTSAVRAETVRPSLTLPSHTSMISGVEPDRHGVDWNSWQAARQVDVPTVFSSCREARLRCGLFAGKRKFAHFAVSEPGVEQYGYTAAAEDILELALDYLDERLPHFVMAHLPEVDAVGHADGWGSHAQREQIERIDEAVGDFLDEARDEYEGRLTVIVTADHGGDGRRHGAGRERDVRIPWIAWGNGVPRGGRLAHVRIVDTAATVLGLLGISAPSEWRGRSHYPFDVEAGAVDVGSGTSGGEQ